MVNLGEEGGREERDRRESERGASRAGPARAGTGLPLATWQQGPPGVGSL